MSMPGFPNLSKIPTTEQAFAAIITSIAMEETALSHVINAESEKIKFVVECAKRKGCDVADINELLAVNKSASDVLKTIVELQTILKEKFAIAVKHMPEPIPPCVPKFVAQPGYIWHKNATLFLMEKEQCKVESEPCDNGIRLTRRNGESVILLPQGKNFKILFELEAINKGHNPAKIAIEFRLDKNIIKTEILKQDEKKIKVYQLIQVETPVGDVDMTISFKLLSPASLSCIAGAVTIFES